MALGLVVMSLSALAAQGRQAVASDPLLTTPERTGYEQTSRYDET